MRTNEQLRALGIRLESISSFPGALSLRFHSSRGTFSISIESDGWHELPSERLELEALRLVMAEWQRRDNPQASAEDRASQ